MKAILFDLDNTLYPEEQYVRSGMSTVAQFLAPRYGLDEDQLTERMLWILKKDGRGRVFDTVLRDLGLYSHELVALLVYLYRTHRPRIRLLDDVLPTLNRLRERNLLRGLVTDGMASVQRKKVTELGLEQLMDGILYTDELIREQCKPSALPFKVLLKWLSVAPAEAAYIGDDPSKDFIGPKSLGMLTIRVRTSMPNGIAKAAPFRAADAKHMVEGLQEILPILGA